METQFNKEGGLKTASTIMNRIKRTAHEKVCFIPIKKIKRTPFMSTLLLLLAAFTMNAQVGAWNLELENETQEALDTLVVQTTKLASY